MSSEKKSKEYPRALPHRAPEKVASPLDRSSEDTAVPPVQPRSVKFLLFGMVCFLVLAGVGSVLWWNKVRMSSDVEISAAPQPVSPSSLDLESAISTSPKPSVELAVVKSKTDGEPLAIPTKKPPTDTPVISKIAENAQKGSSDPQSPSKERYLEALGSLTAAHLYQSFLNIGLLADAVESEQLDRAEAEKTLANVVGFMTLVENQLDQIAKTNLDPNDQKALQNIRKQTEFLRVQASALQAYWTTGKADHATRFHEARKQAWSGISEMLGLDSMELETPDSSLEKTLGRE